MSVTQVGVKTDGQRFLFGDVYPDLSVKPKNIETEGIKYIGSKKEILPKILLILALLRKQTSIKTILDGFSGSTRVTQMLAKSGFDVLSNDTAIYSRIFAECYLMTKKNKEYYAKKIEKLNVLEGKSGWFSKHYGGTDNDGLSVGDDGKKKMWQLHNTKKLDAVLEAIHAEQDEQDKNVLLTSLILGLDKVDSSLGHQVSYLKEWAKRSYNELALKVPNYFINSGNHAVYNKDIFELINEIDVDVAYYDPPYCSNNEKMPASRVRYNSYYHIWTSICLNDIPEVFGACNRRLDTSDKTAISVFEEFRKDTETDDYITTLKIKELIQKTSAKFIIFSYSSSGRTDKKSFKRILNELGLNFLFYEFNYKKNIMHALKSTNEWVNEQGNREYLIVIDKYGVLDLEKVEKGLTSTPL
ncbi:MAG: DNA adenine methylase [Candidatus Kaiserbacteria bacterium]|nr:DNA adenine methylase [Candidatus Kaiserbacteria bacterium]